MSVTAKELAKLLGISEAAVSFALNNKPGVSPLTRQLVLEKAVELGYDFSRSAALRSGVKGTVCYAVFRRSGALIGDTPFFSCLAGGVAAGCGRGGYDVAVRHLYADDSLDEQLYLINKEGFSGIVLLGTELNRLSLEPFLSLEAPVVLLDARFDGLDIDCVSADDAQGAFAAASYLFDGRRKRLREGEAGAGRALRPGYLKSAFATSGFDAREGGYYRAVRESGLVPSACIVHRLSPTREGAFADMRELLRAGVPLPDCYFADSDLIAAGAMDALAEAGIAIPRDIGIVGFGDIPLCQALTPPLSTVRVPTQVLGELAAQRLVQRMERADQPPVKLQVGVSLIRRKSV